MDDAMIMQIVNAVEYLDKDVEDNLFGQLVRFFPFFDVETEVPIWI